MYTLIFVNKRMLIFGETTLRANEELFIFYKLS